MNRIAPRTLLLLTITVLAAALSAACSRDAESGFRGYVEGEYVYVAAPFAGYLDRLTVRRGQRVAAGQPLFALGGETERLGLAEAEARAQAAASRADNLLAARRAPEIRTLEAELAAARATLQLAESRLAQETALAAKNFVAEARVDDATAQRDQAQAQVRALDAQLALARTPIGRSAEARAAREDQQAAAALAGQRRWLVQRKDATAPTAGELADTYYRTGEWVSAGSPVVSILPDDGRRLRFFVPETRLAEIRPGTRVEAQCDACPAPIRGVIDFVAPQPEYTPPVIYSRDSREKLVFRVEAVPDAGSGSALPPGLPISVTLVN